MMGPVDLRVLACDPPATRVSCIFQKFPAKSPIFYNLPATTLFPIFCIGNVPYLHENKYSRGGGGYPRRVDSHFGRVPAKSYGQTWIRITIYRVSDLRTISSQTIDSKRPCIK